MTASPARRPCLDNLRTLLCFEVGGLLVRRTRLGRHL